MAGHSKWSNIKRKKEVNDAKKSKVFTKLAKEITVASRQGGPEPEFNPRLRLAIQNAKGANMPKEAILRAINKGDTTQGDEYQEVTYEGYGPHGVAIMVVCMTDKITRTVANVRTLFSKHGGSLEKKGSIAFLFNHKGVFTIPISDETNEETFALELIDSGAETIEIQEETIHITCAIEDFGNVQKQLEKRSIIPIHAGLQHIPHTFTTLTDEALIKLTKLIDALEDDDDVQKVYHNIAIGPNQGHLLYA